MRGPRPTRTTLALLTALALGAAGPPCPGAPPAASLGGTIHAAEAHAPLVGGRVHATNSRTGETFVSAPTGPRGVFRLAKLPPAEYRVTVETRGGLYAVGPSIALGAGQDRLVRLAVRAAAPAPEGEDTAKRRRTPWNKPAAATGIVIGIAVLLGFLFDELTEDETVASEVVI